MITIFSILMLLVLLNTMLLVVSVNKRSLLSDKKEAIIMASLK
jgi:hypothetical protein